MSTSRAPRFDLLRPLMPSLSIIATTVPVLCDTSGSNLRHARPVSLYVCSVGPSRLVTISSINCSQNALFGTIHSLPLKGQADTGYCLVQPKSPSIIVPLWFPAKTAQLHSTATFGCCHFPFSFARACQLKLLSTADISLVTEMTP